MSKSLEKYREVLVYRNAVPYYEPMVSRTPYSYHQGVFTFLYIEINKQRKEIKRTVSKKSLFILD